MSTIPTRHHRPREMLVFGLAVAVMAALLVLFNGGAIWYLAIPAFIALLPVANRGEAEGVIRHRAIAAGAVVAIAILIWLT